MTNRAVGGLVAAVIMGTGLLELTQLSLSHAGYFVGFVFVACLAAAVGAARWAPGLALGAAWTAGLTQVVAGVPILFSEAALIFVVFAAARWGRAPTVVLAGFSVLLVPALALGWLQSAGPSTSRGGAVLFELLGTVLGAARVGVLALGLGLLSVPFLAGLVLRYFDRARVAQDARRSAELEAAQAQAIARLQEQQNRLARDVHDVVGHSLTVILAQAESAQFIDDPARLKRTMETIVTSARTSLQDVRQVLTPGFDGSTGRRGGLDELIEAVRSSGHPLLATEAGSVRPLPPELDAVAYRVLQEMLTNAIKHGQRDRPIQVERQWSADSLRITVRNVVGAAAPAPDGQGVAGMRGRLESVGGRLEVQRREETFAATAVLPVRSSTAGSS